jgi:hypothetical protein
MPLSVTGHSDANANAAGLTSSRFDGFMTRLGQCSGPEEMRIPPLRSAVKMGSDVSPGSSVPPGRSADRRTGHGPRNGVCTRMGAPANPRASCSGHSG